MRLSNNIFYSFPALGSLAALLFAGCANYDNPEEWKSEIDEGEGYLAISLTVGGDNRFASRAESDPTTHPYGKEDGDGREMGQHHENDIDNLVIYYYNDGSKDAEAAKTGPGIGSPANTFVYHLVTIPKSEIPDLKNVSSRPENEHGNYTGHNPDAPLYAYIKLPASRVNNYTYKPGDHFIVVANMAESAFTGITTLGALRDKLVDNAWTGSGTNKGAYTSFVMSNEADSRFDDAHTSTKDDPMVLCVDIERVAARLDFCTDNSVTKYSSLIDSKPTLAYDAMDKAQGASGKTKVGDVYLTHVQPFNVMQKPTYLIKRSASPALRSNPTYLADETHYYNQTFETFPLVVEPHTWAKSDATNLATLVTTENYYNTAYNTYYPSITDDSWFTDAYRVHWNIATDDDGFTPTGISTNGDEFCRDYYVIDYANENTQEAGKTTAEVTTGYLLRAVYRPAVVYSSETDANNKENGNTTFAGGTDFWRYRPMVTIYDEHQSVYFSNSGAAEAYAALHPGVPFKIEFFDKGRCYYPVFLRHDNGDDAQEFHPEVTPMEYGIVRNNIYRLKVSFTGPGYNTIPENPREPLGIKPYIYVRKWYQITHPEIPV